MPQSDREASLIEPEAGRDRTANGSNRKQCVTFNGPLTHRLGRRGLPHREGVRLVAVDLTTGATTAARMDVGTGGTFDSKENARCFDV